MSPRRGGYRAEGEDGAEVPWGSFLTEGRCTQATGQTLFTVSSAFTCYFGATSRERPHRSLALAKPLLACDSCLSRRALADAVLPRAGVQDRNKAQVTPRLLVVCWHTASKLPLCKQLGAGL